MNWLTNLEQAKEESVKTHKPILLQFEMDGCGGCKKLNATTYKDLKVIDEMNEWFVLLKLDLIKDREIRKSLGAYWTPAMYFLDQNGNSYFHFNGYLPADEFRAMLRLGIAETIMPRVGLPQCTFLIRTGIHIFTLMVIYRQMNSERCLD